MKRSIFYPAHPITVAAVCVAGIFTIGSATLQAKEVRVDRYTTLKATPTPTPAQAELLETTVSLHLPERIQTVGEAVRYLLQRSGYRLAATGATSAEAIALLALPLPAFHRSLGPITLREALETLAGPVFHLVQDPVHRLVTFERCAGTAVHAKGTRTALNGGLKDDH